METNLIQSKIYTIRGQKVMLDFDLAALYDTETKRLKESVKRNGKRFPPDFMFELTNTEWQSLRSQFATSNRGGHRYLPYAFTEQGVAMLSGLLNSDVAIEMNIAIMRAFVATRHLLIHSPIEKMTELQQEVRELRLYMEEVFADQNDINEDTRMQLELINRSLAELQTDKRLSRESRRRIGFHTNEE
ncbi:ORF6N domain-containing protein [Paludibacter sp.]|uniref:ORF6N domain-containing protein n=1 Tax=Paludibacter sp. TaxID=1898105 RepID=UPI0013561774|nr:ORF6N domain-containing protein [Paludibacter sp.]MTK52023.1 ORF6N domain-containing protein [Paludibacter sp.]